MAGNRMGPLSGSPANALQHLVFQPLVANTTGNRADHSGVAAHFEQLLQLGELPLALGL